MLSLDENERLCRVGPGTPMGRLMRSYWQPALLSEDVPERAGAPIRITLLGESLIAFRDTDGKVGLVDAFCPHRRAPMFFGRNEECGLRCVYHGWKFDRTGACVDMPSEPADSLFKTKVAIKAYPTWEGGGIVWAYLGPADAIPGAPDFELVRTSPDHRNVTMFVEHCNYLQVLEGGLDSVHTTFLHNNDISDTSPLRSSRCDETFETTDWGLHGAAIHELPGGASFVRTFDFVMPQHSIRPRISKRDGGPEPIPTISGQIFVPLDDHSCALYNYFYSADPSIPLTAEFIAGRNAMYGRAPDDLAAPHLPKRTMANDYLIDRKLQKTRSYTGIAGMNMQDVAVQEGMGAIVDRSHEHLAYSDRIIIALRKLLFEGIDDVEAGRRPRGVEPAAYRRVRAADIVMPSDADWQSLLRNQLLARF
jgi:phthalate 4,5-dioxygenase